MAEPVDAAPSADRGVLAPVRVFQLLVLAVLAGVVLMLFGAETPVPFVGWYVVSAVVPATALVLLRPRGWVLPVMVAVTVLSVLWFTVDRLDPGRPEFERRHDGGVVATMAAAGMVLDGRNPYTADFTDSLKPDHHLLAEGQDAEQVNPLTAHYPYLPGAFLVQVPVAALAGMWGGVGDSRLIYAACFAGALAMLVGGSRPRWARAAAVAALGLNLAVAIYLPWGANDVAAASLLVVGFHAARRRPVAAALAVALAISLKAILVVALWPLALLALASGGRSHLVRVFAPLGGALVVSCLPFALWSPSDFWEDTVAFNLGRTDLAYPTSGIGLGAAYPDLFTEPVVLVLSLVLVALATLLTWRAVRARPLVSVGLAGTGAMVFAGLLPARTFQVSYLPLFVLLWAPIWADLPLGAGGVSGVADGSGAPDGLDPRPLDRAVVGRLVNQVEEGQELRG